MTRHLQFLCACTCLWLLTFTLQAVATRKWARQLETTDPAISDSFDWIPLAQPADSATQTKDRSGNERVLTYSQAFPTNGHFSDLTKGYSNGAVSQKSSPFDFPYQFQNFGNLPQAQSLKQPAAGIKTNIFPSQDPTSQSFFKFEMPLNPQTSSRLNAGQLNSGGNGVNTGYQISHAFGGGAQATLFNSPLYNQQPVFPPEFHPVQPAKSQTQKPLLQNNFLSNEPISLKNFFKDNKPTASPLHDVSPQVFPQDDAQNNPTYSLKAPFNTIPSGPAPTAPAPPQDQQFLFVPYNDIFNQVPQAQPSIQQLPQPQVSAPAHPQLSQKPSPAQLQNPYETAAKYSNSLPTVNPYQINQFYTPDTLGQPQPQLKYYSTSTTSTTIRPQTTSLRPANIFQNFVSPQYNTTPKPKPKAHQPPLAMFLLRSSARPAETDVVEALSSSKSIAVIDSPNQNPPEIFVGPSGMPIPNGYTKFDLPYLSQLQGSQNINDVSFFVAPLSYRTPVGFNKILLPEPHVGSIVINLSKSEAAQPATQYYQPQPQPPIEQSTTTTYRPRTSPQRVKAQQQNLHNNRGNKFSYYYDQDPIQEVQSPQVLHKERPKKKRPQSVKIEQPSFSQQLSNPYAQFNPIPNQIANDDFYKLPAKPSTSSTTSTTSTTSTSTSTTSTTQAPQNYFAYNTHPQVEYPGGSGHLYPEINQIPQQQLQHQQPQLIQQQEKPRITTRPTVTATTAEEEYRMKQYYRKQEAHRQRPQIVAPTSPPYEQVQYTPVNLEYEIPKTTTNKPRITFYSPTAAPAHEEEYNTVPSRQQQQEQQPELHQGAPAQTQQHNQLQANHRPSYLQNEITDSPVEYEPNPYQLPSELPQLTPNFPGLVNNLKDMKDQQQAAGPSPPEPTTSTQEQTTVAPLTYQEPESSTRPTRKPINRTRKPVATRVTSSVSYSESETFTRRPINRVRRPYGSRQTAATASTASPINLDYDDTTTSTKTRRPSSNRNPLIRNPNRIRYKPTPEERQTLRIKPKRKYNGSSKVVNESEDLDYQRDVLKQNYPVFKPASSRRPSSSPTAIPASYDAGTTEAATSETQQIYTVTPSNSIDHEQTFPAGILEPMQIAQQYNEYKNNYGPGYFPNQEDISPTEPVLRNEINPIYSAQPSTATSTSTTTTTTTTTTEAPPEITTRRSPFIRRNYPRLRTTTTETPTTSTPAEEEKPSTRNRVPPRKVIKVRARTRRPPHTAAPTPAAEDEIEPTEQPKQNYRKLNRFNQDLYDNETPRRRYKQKFQLEGQESQWAPSAKIGPTNNFKPINPKENKDTHKFENEPEIVTAGPAADNKDNYEIKVSANYGPPAPNMKQPNLKPEKSFAELLEEVMGKAPEEKTAETTTSPELSTDGTVFEAQKTTIANRILRRGKWKKTRVTSSVSSSNGNAESFETAESQNLGSQLLNSLQKTDKPPTTILNPSKDWKTTTPITTAAEINSMYNTFTTTPIPLTSMEDYSSVSTLRPQELQTTTLPMNAQEEAKTSSMQTTNLSQHEESATRRMDDDMAMEDDLEIQPSLFSEVKKQLHELFSIEESDDTAVTAALAAVGKRRQEYTHIKRPKLETTTTASAIDLVSITEPMSVADKKAFHRELMRHVVFATSAPVQLEETSEAEICYRGRCIKSDDLPANHKLN